MKTIFKPTSILVAVVLILLLSSFLSSSESNYKYAIMRVADPLKGSYLEGKICIVYENGIIEETALEKSKGEDFLSKNIKKINDAINNISSKGYQLVTQTVDQYNVHNYTFVKK